MPQDIPISIPDFRFKPNPRNNTTTFSLSLLLFVKPRENHRVKCNGWKNNAVKPVALIFRVKSERLALNTDSDDSDVSG